MNLSELLSGGCIGPKGYETRKEARPTQQMLTLSMEEAEHIGQERTWVLVLHVGAAAAWLCLFYCKLVTFPSMHAISPCSQLQSTLAGGKHTSYV
jgi:hypothetical protein